jgi:hypothetical protein
MSTGPDQRGNLYGNPDINAEALAPGVGEQALRAYVDPTEVLAVPADSLVAGTYNGNNQDPTGWRQ